MGFKLGAMVGFGAGYYLGAKAGRERYEQLNRWADKAKQTEAYGAAAAKARDLADEGLQRAKQAATGGGAGSKAPLGDDGPDFPDDYSNN